MANGEDQYMRQLAQIMGVDPATLQSAGSAQADLATAPQVWLPGKKRQRVKSSTYSNIQPGYSPGQMPTPQYESYTKSGVTDAAEVLNWTYDPKKYDRIKSYLEKRGFETGSFIDVDNAWKEAVGRASDVYESSGKKMKVSPWEILDLLAPPEEEKARRTPWRGESFTTTDTTKHIFEMGPETARSLLSNALKDALGRAPTQEEIEDFASRANAIVGANPQVSKTTSTFEWDDEASQLEDGTVVGDYRQTGSTTRQVGPSQEEVQAQVMNEAQDRAMADDEYAEYQSSTTLMNWLFNAVQSPV